MTLATIRYVIDRKKFSEKIVKQMFRKNFVHVKKISFTIDMR